MMDMKTKTVTFYQEMDMIVHQAITIDFKRFTDL